MVLDLAEDLSWRLAMALRIICMCGYVIQGDDDDEQLHGTHRDGAATGGPILCFGRDTCSKCPCHYRIQKVSCE